MNTNEPICTNCGTPLPPDAPRGLCPSCLVLTALAPGERLHYFGDYELIEEIGAGGMGLVWKARQVKLNRIVALKMIRSGMLANDEEVRRFLSEAEAAANLQHPGIVAIHQNGEFEGQHFYSMDYVDGKNLAEYRDGRPLPARQAAELIATISDAVQFAHQRGVLHRDLKPQNVMIDSEGRPRLTDFGLAKRLDAASALTQTGAMIGSPSYMAPETALAQADRVGPHTDVYALGAVLYEMLTGRAPFRAETPAETMMRVVNSEPLSPSSLNPDTPRDLEIICLKCLEKEPSRRYPTAKELAEDVRRWVRHEPIIARPASVFRKVESWVRRHPWTIAALASAVILVLACVVDLLFEQNNFLRARQQNPSLTRTPGALTRQLDIWSGLSFLAFQVLIGTVLVLKKVSRNLTWAETWDPKSNWKSPGLISPQFAAACAFIAIAAAAYATALLLKLIEVYVWEGTVPWFGAIMLYPLCFFPVMLFTQAMRSLRGSGASIPSLSPAALEQVESAIRDGEFGDAINRVRAAAPGTSRADAQEAVERIAQRIETGAPGTLVAPGSLRVLNVRMLFAVLAAEVILIYTLWALFSPSDPARFWFKLASGLLFGSGIIAGVMLKGFWMRFLAVLPGALILPIIQDVLLGDAPGTHTTFFAFFIGTFLGFIAMMAAFTRRRSKA